MLRFFLLIILLSAGSKHSEAATLKIEGGYSGYWWGLKLIESDNEDDTIRVYFYDNWKGKPIKIKDLRSAKYIVNLVSIFGDVFIDSLTIDKRTTYEIKTSSYYDYCSDSSLIEQMQVGDSLVGLVEFFGCFPSLPSRFKLVKAGDEFKVKWIFIHSDTAYIFSNSKIEYLIQQEKLSNLGVRNIKPISRNATGTSSYTIKLGNCVSRFNTGFVERRKWWSK